MQHAIDLDGGNRRALQRRQQYPPEGIAERQSESPLQGFGDDGRAPLGNRALNDLKFRRFNKVLPIFLNHGCVSLPQGKN